MPKTTRGPLPPLPHKLLVLASPCARQATASLRPAFTAAPVNAIPGTCPMPKTSRGQLPPLPHKLLALASPCARQATASLWPAFTAAPVKRDPRNMPIAKNKPGAASSSAPQALGPRFPLCPPSYSLAAASVYSSLCKCDPGMCPMPKPTRDRFLLCPTNSWPGQRWDPPGRRASTNAALALGAAVGSIRAKGSGAEGLEQRV